jgi:hypothetical protein
VHTGDVSRYERPKSAAMLQEFEARLFERDHGRVLCQSGRWCLPNTIATATGADRLVCSLCDSALKIDRRIRIQRMQRQIAKDRAAAPKAICPTCETSTCGEKARVTHRRAGCEAGRDAARRRDEKREIETYMVLMTKFRHRELPTIPPVVEQHETWLKHTRQIADLDATLK